MVCLLVFFLQEWETIEPNHLICHPTSSNLIAYSLGHQDRNLLSVLPKTSRGSTYHHGKQVIQGTSQFKHDDHHRDRQPSNTAIESAVTLVTVTSVAYLRAAAAPK